MARPHPLKIFRDRATELEAVASDMFGCRSYVVVTSETSLRPSQCEPYGWNGLAGPFLSQLFRGDVRRVTQAGPAVLIDDRFFIDRHPVKDSLDWFTALVIHELGHVACDPIPFALFIPEHEHSATVRERIEQPEKFFADRPAYSPRDQHGADWIRLMIHVGTRIVDRNIGRRTDSRFSLHWSMCADMSHYQYSPLIDYVAALGDEPHDLRDVPICDVKHVPIPAEFMAIWQRDIAERPDF